MPHHKSCKKRMVTSKKANIRNRQIKSNIKTAVKKVLEAKDNNGAQEALQSAFSVLDKAAQKRIIHKNKSSNQKARLCSVVSKIAAA